MHDGKSSMGDQQFATVRDVDPTWKEIELASQVQARKVAIKHTTGVVWLPLFDRKVVVGGEI